MTRTEQPATMPPRRFLVLVPVGILFKPQYDGDDEKAAFVTLLAGCSGVDKDTGARRPLQAMRGVTWKPVSSPARSLI